MSSWSKGRDNLHQTGFGFHWKIEIFKSYDRMSGGDLGVLDEGWRERSSNDDSENTGCIFCNINCGVLQGFPLEKSRNCTRVIYHMTGV